MSLFQKKAVHDKYDEREAEIQVIRNEIRYQSYRASSSTKKLVELLGKEDQQLRIIRKK